MIHLLSNVRLVVGAVILTLGATGWGLYFYSLKKIDLLNKQLSETVVKLNSCTEELRKSSKACEKAINSVKQACEERIRVEIDRMNKKLKACEVEKDRLRRLLNKLEEIENL